MQDICLSPQRDICLSNKGRMRSVTMDSVLFIGSETRLRKQNM